MRDYYLPGAYVEALGWVTIAHSQLEFVLNSLAAALERHLLYLGREPNRSLHAILPFLEEISQPGVLRPEWSEIVRGILADSTGPLLETTQASLGIIYTRGGGSLELAIRTLAAESESLPPPANISLARLLKLEQDLRSISYSASSLALRILRTLNDAEGASEGWDGK